MPYRVPTVFGKHHTGNQLCSTPMIQINYTTSDWLVSETNLKHTVQGTNCVQESPYMETTVFTEPRETAAKTQ